MNLKSILAVSSMVLASTAAFADGGDIGIANYPVASHSTVTRASVDKATLAARADGELRVAGEAGDTPYAFEQPTHSDLSRAQVKLATLQAAKAGELIPAGEGPEERPAGEFAHPATSNNVFASLARKFRSN